MRIFFAPRSNERSYSNFRSTITNGVPADVVRPFLSDDEKKVLAGQEKFYIWGNLESIRSRWEEMQIGDLVLFYRKGFFVYAGTCSFKKYSRELGLQLWPASPENDNNPWSCLFFINNLVPIKVPIQEINELAGYKSNFIVQGFMKYVPYGTENLLKKYGNISNFIQKFHSTLPSEEIVIISAKTTNDKSTGASLEAVDTLVRQYDEDSILDVIAERNKNETPEMVERIVKKFERDVGLVRMLKKLYSDKCQVCGLQIKTKSGKYYSEVAHIQPLSSGVTNVDTMQNMLVLCPNHHKLLDLGDSHFEEPDKLVINGKSFTLHMKHKVWSDFELETK